MEKDNKTLHLVLKKQWWDMIESGVKKEEYRSISEYWIKRLTLGKFRGNGCLDSYKPYKEVCFHLGYTNVTMKFEIACITQGLGVKEWGGGNMRVFIISLGKRLK